VVHEGNGKNIHTFREFYQDIVKDIIIKTARHTDVHRVAVAATHHTNKQHNKNKKQKNSPQPLE
jgi:ABC-type sulfate transport system substrate-binding protein